MAADTQGRTLTAYPSGKYEVPGGQSGSHPRTIPELRQPVLRALAVRAVRDHLKPLITGGKYPSCRDLLFLRWFGPCILNRHPHGIVMSVFFPAAALNAPRRLFTWLSAGCYYAGAAWSLIPAARNFFGPNVGMLQALAWWLTSAALLSLPWAWAWTKERNHAGGGALLPLALPSFLRWGLLAGLHL